MVHEKVYAMVQGRVSENLREIFVEFRNISLAVSGLTCGQFVRRILSISLIGLRLQVLQRTPQLVPRAMDVGLYGAEREIQSSRDFLVRPSLHVTQQNAGSILGS